jgi:glyoxylase-like metal-dependent hydrolase (beta-lactamase superfamily II)
MQIGDYRVEVIPDTEFWLDGGAMFGVVPRVLWERVCPPDKFNRVRLNANCLFIDTGNEKVLIETGIGEKWSAKEISMYGITRKKPFAESLHEIADCRPEDITVVINTHLHFDHAGGNTINECGVQSSECSFEKVSTQQRAEHPISKIRNDVEQNDPRSAIRDPQFKNARYLVSRSELHHAESPHERDRASYLPENWHPLLDSQLLELMPNRYEPVPGLTVELVRGHSETMQTIRLTRGGETLYGFFDLIPTRHHLPPAWIMAYDLFPTETLEFKKRVLPQALEENWICHFYHDVETPLCRLAEVNDKITAVPLA